MPLKSYKEKPLRISEMMKNKRAKNKDFIAFNVVFDKITCSFLSRKSISYKNIAALWHVIFGDSKVAREVKPLKLIKKKPQQGTLVIEVEKEKKLKWQHQSEIIVNKINQFFEHKIVLMVKVIAQKSD